MDIERLIATTEPPLAKGLREILRAAFEGNLKSAIVASDADDAFREKIQSACAELGIPVYVGASVQELGRICKIDVPCGAVGILKSPNQKVRKRKTATDN